MFGTTPMIIFDDDLGELGPMTDLRAAFEVRTGMLTTADRIVARRTESLVGYWVPQRLQTLVAERVETPVNTLPSGREILCANGRWRMPDRRLRLKPAFSQPLIEGLRVLADPFDVMHGMKSLRRSGQSYRPVVSAADMRRL